MIGPEFTVITTSLGSLPAKRTTTLPDFAGALVREIKALDLPAGTPVVIVVSGSLVGANIATIAATEALGLRPVVISLTGASKWGAKDQSGNAAWRRRGSEYVYLWVDAVSLKKKRKT